MEEQKRYWTKEAARRLGVHPKTLRAWIADNKGPEYTEFNKRKYFTAEALDRFIADRTKSEVRTNA
ncbi:MAG TPA: helix-turn-helix domain-containing protein [Oculatellaceae cyanobacterium]